MFYPGHYNGAFVACPDPVDFHAYMTVDLYKQDNMFYIQGANKQVEQPGMRDYLGHTLMSMRDNIAYEAALGDRGAGGRAPRWRDRPRFHRAGSCPRGLSAGRGNRRWFGRGGRGGGIARRRPRSMIWHRRRGPAEGRGRRFPWARGWRLR